MWQDDSPQIRKLVAELQKLCAKLPGSEQYVMVHHPAFRVGKRPFVVVGMHVHGVGDASISINLGHEAQHGLLSDERFIKTPYMGHNGWVTIARKALGAKELSTLVMESWRRIANKKQLAALTR